MARIGLDELGGAYRRVQRSITRSAEDAAEFGNETIFDALNKDQTIVDAAFFVLIFGQLEERINALALGRATDILRRNALREAKFEKRLEIALQDRGDLKKEIGGWYSVRNDAAHGKSIASDYEIKAVLERAQQIEALLASPS